MGLIKIFFFLFPKRQLCTSLEFAALWPIWALADHNGGCRMILPDDMLATAQCAIRKPFVCLDSLLTSSLLSVGRHGQSLYQLRPQRMCTPSHTLAQF